MHTLNLPLFPSPPLQPPDVGGEIFPLAGLMKPLTLPDEGSKMKPWQCTASATEASSATETPLRSSQG